MFCPKCGAQSAAHDECCAACGYDFGLIPEHLREKPITDTEVFSDTAYAAVEATAERSGGAVFTETVQKKEAPVRTYMIRAILLTIFGSMAFGIVSVIFSGMTQTELAAGNKVKAREYSEKTRMFCRISLFVGIAKYLFLGIMLILLAIRAF